MISVNPKIGFIGFGEVAYHLSRGLKEEGVEQVLAFTRPGSQSQYNKRAKEANVELVSILDELVSRSEIIISAVHGHVALDDPDHGPGLLIEREGPHHAVRDGEDEQCRSRGHPDDAGPQGLLP